jgi:hypothetical protein
MVANAGAGPQPIAYREQTVDKLAQQIQTALQPEMMVRARQIGVKLQRERGCENGARSFHGSLLAKHSRCSIFPESIAVWEVKGKESPLSTLAAAILLERGLISVEDIFM